MNGTSDLQTWADVAQAGFAALGVIFVVTELRRNTQLTKAQLIAQMNDRLSRFSDIAGILQSRGDEDASAKLEPNIRERVLDYVSVFETIESMRRVGTLTAREMDYFFAGRFMELVGRPGLQKAIFFNQGIRDQLYPIFSLHKHVIHERAKRVGPQHATLAALKSFADRDPVAYQRLSRMQ